MKQMFDMSEKLIVGQSDEIYGVNTINWEDSSWRQLSLVNDEEIISVSDAKVHVFSDSVLCLGKMNQNRQSNTDWENKLTWFKSSPQYRTLDTIDGEPMKIRVEYCKGFTTLQLVHEVQEFVSKMCKQPEEFAGRIIFMSMFNDISWRSKDNKQECESSAQLFSLYAKRFGAGRCSFLWLGSEKKWYSTHEKQTTRKMRQSRRTDDAGIFRKRTPNFPCHESFVPRNAQKQRRWKIINTLLCWSGNDWNCFSHN